MKRGCIALLVMVLILSACAQRVPTEEETPPSVPTSAPEVITAPAQPATPAPELTPTPSDTTAPSAITGLMAVNAYDGKVNLWWDKSGAEDFDHYNIYVSESEMGDVAGTSPIYQIKNISTTNYQATGLEDGTEYYFAVMAVDKNGNEERRVTSRSATPTPMPRGTEDPDFQVDVYQSDMVWAGTTLLPDNHNLERPRIMEINMLGEVVWEYILPENLKQYTNPGFDVELLSNNNILFVLPRKGVYEIDRNGKVVWSYLTDKISHDADRLPNGNTIFAFGAYDKKDDAQVIEVNQEGEVTWSWYARGYFDKPPYKDIDDEGWTHTNAVTRLPNGNTLISPRNFDFVVEVNPGGSVVRTIGEGILDSQHDPEVLVNGNILLMNQTRPHRAIEIDPKTGSIVWQSQGFARETVPVRDANRLPNGNTLITGSTEIVEVTLEGKIVWRLVLNVVYEIKEAARHGFYKAERISPQR